MKIPDKSLDLQREYYLSSEPIELQFKFLQELNTAISCSLNLVDFGDSNPSRYVPGTLSNMLSIYRGLIYNTVKDIMLAQGLDSTAVISQKFILNLSRSKCRKFSNYNQNVDSNGEWSLFSQAFKVIHKMKPTYLRRRSQLYDTVFMGEHSHDAGGPYRESFAVYAQELQSTLLPLLVKSPNSILKVGKFRDRWVFNPGCNSPKHLDMLSFLGKLMGVAIRSKEYLALSIAPLIW